MLRLPHPGPLTLLSLVKVALETGLSWHWDDTAAHPGMGGVSACSIREESKGQTDECEWRPGGDI